MGLSLIQEYSSGFVTGGLGLPSGSPQQVLGTPSGIGTCVAICITPQANAVGTVTAVTSSMGTFTRVNDVAGGTGTFENEWWVCLKTTASASTITVTTTGSVGYFATAFEWYGGVSSATSGGALAYGSIAVGAFASLAVSCAPGDAVLVGGNTFVCEPPTTVSQPSPPWVIYPQPPSSGNYGQVIAYQVTTASSITASWKNVFTGPLTTNLLGLILVPDTPVPATPTLISPANASIFDISSGVSFQATYNAAGSDAMNAYALRVKLSGGSYNYWNAGTNSLQSSIVWNSDSVIAGQNFTVSLPAAAFANGNTYNWSFACQDSVSGGQGGFATDFTFTSQASPTVTVTNPTGTVGTTTQPTVQWTVTTAPGTIQVTYSIVVESGTFGTTPGSGTQVWASGAVTSGLNAAQVGIPLLTGTSYRAFVQITETGGQSSAWGFTTFTISVDTPATPTVTATPSTDPVTGCPIIQLQVQGLDNYATAVDSSFETGIGTAVGTACTVAQSSAQHLDGTHCLSMTCSSAGTMSVKLGPYAASPGEQVKAFAAFRANSTARTCSVGLQWQGAAGTPVSTGTADSSAAWTQATSASAPPAGLVVTGTAPAGTTGVFVVLTVAAAALSEVHFADCVFVGPSTATVWGLGGFVGLTTAVILRSDNQYVRWASVANPLPIPNVGQLATVYDYEAIPGTQYSYTAYVQVASVPLQSATATSAQAQVPTATYGWWELNPLAGSATSNPSAVNANVTSWTPVQTEQATANQVLNQPHMNIVANAMMNQDFAGEVETFSDSVYAAFNALLTSQATVFISSPWGAIDSGYFRIGPQSGGLSSGMGTTAKNTTLMPSVIGKGHRTTQITAVSQARPSV